MAFSGTKKAPIDLLVIFLRFLYGIITVIKRSEKKPIFFRRQIRAIPLMNLVVSI
jgi:hypothetical protein